MKNSKRIISIFIFFFCFYSFAEELSFEQLMNLYGDESDWPLCEELADTFCESFLSAENLGNFQFSDGEEILNGYRRKNVISNKEFIHLQKVVKSRCRLPADIFNQTAISLAVSKLQDSNSSLSCNDWEEMKSGYFL